MFPPSFQHKNIHDDFRNVHHILPKQTSFGDKLQLSLKQFASRPLSDSGISTRDNRPVSDSGISTVETLNRPVSDSGISIIETRNNTSLDFGGKDSKLSIGGRTSRVSSAVFDGSKSSEKSNTDNEDAKTSVTSYSDLPFDMPKLRRRLAAAKSNSSSSNDNLSTSCASVSKSSKNPDESKPKLESNSLDIPKLTKKRPDSFSENAFTGRNRNALISFNVNSFSSNPEIDSSSSFHDKIFGADVKLRRSSGIEAQRGGSVRSSLCLELGFNSNAPTGQKVGH